MDEKYIGPYLVIGVNGSSCEIESLINKKKKVVHENNLKRFSIDYEIDEVHEENEDLISSESEGEEFVEPLNHGNNNDVEVVQQRYNLRLNRRRPDPYGIPVMNY